MFVNKINSGSNYNNKSFKGYQHVKNEFGKTVHYFYYPFDPEYRNAKLVFYKAKEAPENYQGYEIEDLTPVKTVTLSRETLGAHVDLDSLYSKLGPNEHIAYQVEVDHEAPTADTGIKFEAKKIVNGNAEWQPFTLLPKAVTKPMSSNGLGASTMVDIYKPGAYYHGFESDKTGEIEYSTELQLEREQIKRNTYNKIGGSLAGVEHDIPTLKEKGITTLILPPLAGRDRLYYHRYHNQNNFQMAEEVCNVDNFETFVTSLFKHGMTCVFDGTFTSEGSEGADIQYALKWSHENPDALYRFRFHNIDDAPVSFGIIPKDKENTRFKLVNSPYILAKNDSGKVEVVENKDYRKGKPTYYQIYDVTFVTKEQAESDELITSYASQVTDGVEDKLAVNTYQDLTAPQKNQIFDLPSFKITLENAADFINSSEGPKEINTPEVAMLVAQTAEFEFAQKSRNATLWENKEGLFARNHGFSGNDEKVLMSKAEGFEREQLRYRMERGAAQNVDEDVLVASYWTGFYRDIIISYVVNTLGDVKSVEEIDQLIKDKKLPKEARLTSEQLENIKNGDYYLEPKGELERDEATIKALMSLPIPSLELGDDTVSVLKQGFFFNRASSTELIGKTRYELDLMDNPQLSDIERKIYEKTNKLIKHDIKNFADAVIESIDTNLKERLIDEHGEYTEFGEYLIELIGPKIAKYAYLKSLTGEDFIGKYTKTMPDGSIKYNYDAIRDNTTLEDLDIPSNSMVSNATALQQKMQEGMKKLNKKDVEYLATAFIKKYKNATTLGFRTSEAMYGISSLGLDWRIDALKDVVDIDAVKDLSDTFDMYWDTVIDYYQKLTRAIAEKNPGSKTLGEITDITATNGKTWGEAQVSTRDEDKDKKHFGTYDLCKKAGAKYPDEYYAMRDFWIKSGIVSEANYSDFFTSVIRTFAQDYEDGVSGGSIWNVIKKMQNIVEKRGVDYLRNLYTFNGNHDKPRVVHYAALDMSLFHNDLNQWKVVEDKKVFDAQHNRWAREECMKTLFGVDNYSDLPLEIKLNINNLDYFRTVSPSAVAMCKTLRLGVDKALNDGVIEDKNKKYFVEALADLADGKYLDSGIKFDRQIIKIPEIQDAKIVAKTIIENAQQNYGLKIDEQTKNNWINEIANHFTEENCGRYSVLAGKDETISGNIDWIFEGNATHEKRRADEAYSAHTAKVLALTKEAFEKVSGKEEAAMKAFTGAAIDFLNKYDKDYIDERRINFNYKESRHNADRKHGFANKEFEDTILMLLEQAEHIAVEKGGLKEGEHFKDTNKILETIYETIHEPAMAKSIGMAALVAAVVGIPAENLGDAQGQSGGEYKNNNVYNQNRNVIQRLKNAHLKSYRERMQKKYDTVRNIRNVPGAEALNIGTPYMLEFKNNIGAWLMQSKDSMTITIVTGEGINSGYRGKRDENINNTLKEIVFPEGLLLKKGTEFECITSEGKIKAFIEYFKNEAKGGKWFAKIVGENGANILGSDTVRNGVAVFKRVVKENAENIAKTAVNVSMRGRKVNQQYYITTPVYNTYNTQPQVKEGQKLSLTSR